VAPDVELTGFTVFQRTCATCCDGQTFARL
jgi:hypothetical protein